MHDADLYHKWKPKEFFEMKIKMNVKRTELAEVQ